MSDLAGADSGLLRKLQNLLDIEDIRNLRFQYSDYLDGNDIDLLDRVFAADAVVEVTIGAMRGLSEIKAGLAQAYKDFDRDGRNSYPFLHAVTNHSIKFLGPDLAEGHCYLIDFETASKPDPNPLLLLGLYRDKYQRLDGEWRITHSHLAVVWPSKG
ncbi:nuclear transport factor 2 family protein [Acidisoma silvae]|uniref:Nuclear transport factor 2 family protein n=1 Tax=Acidisoma silvae TaxID=2802396 RepID=A0A964DXS0_9PROT|nr:nuclear transport factor 2 family protein [Acidisoma silvae]MCB8874501.1 nuclear transport factor 2 family protein [Acidisoma silvae]